MKRLLVYVILFIFVTCGCSEVYTTTPEPNTNINEISTSTSAVNSTEEQIVKPTTDAEAIQFIIDKIKYNKYEDAWFYTIDFKSEECKTLNTYARILMLNEEKDYYMRNANIIIGIDPNYTGKLAEEIKAFVLKFADVGKDYEGKSAYIISEEKTKAEIDARIGPKIGMSRTEVYNSTWGSPDDINKTTTENNVSEQWVYEKDKFDFKYIYLDNGIVTAIQE